MYLNKNIMKKIITSILFTLLIIPAGAVLATSGACSFHEGVNCSYGSTNTGKVMCNDGWINSSVYFSDMEECKVDLCPSVISGLSCETESDYLVVQQRVDGMRGSQGAINARRGLLGSPMNNSSTIGQDDLDNCRRDIGLYNGMVASRNQCLQGRTTSQTNQINTEDYVNSKMQEYCEEKQGVNSLWNREKEYCNCKPGYQPTGILSICTATVSKTNDEICKDDFGSHSVVSEEKNNLSTFSCGCESGYKFSGSQPITCVLIPQKTNDEICRMITGPNGKAIKANIPNVAFSCDCADGYKLSEDNQPTCNLIPKIVNEEKDLLQLTKSELQKPEISPSVSDANKLIDLSTSSSATATSTTTNIPIKKLSWFRRFINWFK